MKLKQLKLKPSEVSYLSEKLEQFTADTRIKHGHQKISGFESKIERDGFIRKINEIVDYVYSQIESRLPPGRLMPHSAGDFATKIHKDALSAAVKFIKNPENIEPESPEGLAA